MAADITANPGSWQARCLSHASEQKPDAAVNVAAVERRPGVNSPPAVNRAAGQQHRVPPRLPHVSKVLQVYKKPDVRRHFPLSHRANNHVRLGSGTKRIEFQPLPPGVVTLDTEAGHALSFPHPDKTQT